MKKSEANNLKQEVQQNISLDKAAERYYLKRDEASLEAIIRAAARLVNYFVRIHGLSQSYQDLVQAGNEGLLKAVKRFNPVMGNSFTTYAGSLIAGEIRHHIRKEASYYQPKAVGKLQERIVELINNQLEKTGEAPTMEEISRKLNIREEGVSEVMKYGLVSLDEIDVSKIANIRAESFKLPIEDRILLEQAVRKLSDLQQKVVHMIFYRDMTQEQTAEKLGINQRKVSRILYKSLASMKDDMR